MKLQGLILAGGESKRAGSDKGLKIVDKKTWTKLVYDKLKDFKIKTFVSINALQKENQQKTFQNKLLIIDNLTISGPLRGILSAHLKFPDKDWLVLACDMIEMKSEIIYSLIESYKNESSHDFYVYKNENFYQPFCGIYTSVGLSKLMAKHLNNEMENYSMQYVFKSFDTLSLSVDIGNQSFNNYNHLNS